MCMYACICVYVCMHYHLFMQQIFLIIYYAADIILRARYGVVSITKIKINNTDINLNFTFCA